MYKMYDIHVKQFQFEKYIYTLQMAHCLWFTVMQVQKIFCISSIAFNFPNNDTLTA